MGVREAYLMNKAILIGRLTRDPEVRYTQSGVAVCTFTLAVDRRFARRDANDGQPTADFIPIVAWRKLAEICGNNLIKAAASRWKAASRSGATRHRTVRSVM